MEKFEFYNPAKALEDLDFKIKVRKLKMWEILSDFKEKLKLFNEKWGEKEEFKFFDIAYRGYSPEQWAKKCKEGKEYTKIQLDAYLKTNKKRVEAAKEIGLFELIR